jgi:putative flippase GtrA
VGPLPPAVARWGIFNVVAAGGFVIQITLIALLTRVAGWETWLAAAAGVQAALLHNFVAHGRWTWADRPARGAGALLGRFWRYEAVHLASAAGAVALTAWGVARTGWPPELVNLAAVCTFSVVNYLVSDRALFRPAAGTSLLKTPENTLS